MTIGGQPRVTTVVSRQVVRDPDDEYDVVHLRVQAERA